MEQKAAIGVHIWLLFWMGLWSYEDIKKRSLPVWQLLMVSLTGAFIQGMQGHLLTGETAAGIGIGGMLSVVSAVSKGRLGTGDAWVAGIYGLYLGGSLCLVMLFGGLTLASVYGICLLAGKKGSGKSAIPLVPFLTIPYLIYWSGVCLAPIP